MTYDRRFSLLRNSERVICPALGRLQPNFLMTSTAIQHDRDDERPRGEESQCHVGQPTYHARTFKYIQAVGLFIFWFRVPFTLILTVSLPRRQERRFFLMGVPGPAGGDACAGTALHDTVVDVAAVAACTGPRWAPRLVLGTPIRSAGEDHRPRAGRQSPPPAIPLRRAAPDRPWRG